MRKICSKCKEDKLLLEFHKDKFGKHGHKSYCKQCNRAVTRLWRDLHIEHSRAKAKQWHIDNPEKSKVSGKNTKLKSKYGISLVEYQGMLRVQHGKCAICGIVESTRDPRSGEIRALSVDHCHKTNKIRGLLCQNCNQALGKFKDTVEFLESAISYLRRAA